MPVETQDATLRFFTIGHSSHQTEHFVALLRQHSIDVVVDTRSAPYSRFTPQFDREGLKETLTTAGLRYLWMGDVVGGRPREESCYDGEGRVLYSRVAELAEFKEAVARLERGAGEFRVALLCSEEDPAHCHRRLLISRVLMERGAAIAHIRGDGSIDTDADVVAKSGKPLAGAQPALFPEIDESRWRSTGVIGKKAARSAFD
ncbi:MAG TPA: DUF488 family protein [Acidobacteriaceae bacterium]|nr:DUF488 family protein [Acidobacteriaceae bacterium]